uniref:Uncharacterized protein n=1 Tax=Anguilla anguilla TaxID=7936 RepID=A0A0E9X1C7_ANGAN
MHSPLTNVSSRMGCTEELSDFQCGTAYFQLASLSNFCHARAAPVNCECYYFEVEMYRSNSSSATKRQATQGHRTGLPSAKVCST